jgi:hypothetical protein
LSGGCVNVGARIMSYCRLFGLASIGLAELVDTAFAGTAAVPGPIAGIGLPALAVIGGAYWLGRKLLVRKK